MCVLCRGESHTSKECVYCVGVSPTLAEECVYCVGVSPTLARSVESHTSKECVYFGDCVYFIGVHM